MMFLVMIWDGFLILGEGLGLQSNRARRFADVAWLGCAGLLSVWTAAMLIAVP